MKLNELVVTGFRSIKETERIRIDDRASILIGANDHGKTNILNAIQCLNDDCPLSEDDANWDLHEIEKVRIEWHFKLGKDEKFQDQLNLLRPEPPEPQINDPLELPPEVQAELSRILQINIPELTATDTDFLRARESYLSLEQREKYKEILAKPQENNEESEEPYFPTNDDREIVFFREGFGTPVKILSVPEAKIKQKEESLILKMRPRVELFKTVDNNLKDRVNKKDIEKTEYEFMQGIFMLAGIWTKREDVFENNVKTERLLDEASDRLTKALNKDWNQGKDLEWMLKHKGSDIEIMIKDPSINSRYTHPSTRSSGFKTYFVTSMVIKARTGKHPANSHIYLFDEPGIYLHPKAQLDLQRAFELISDEAQIIYTTHSLFLINKNHPERNKVVSKTKDGTKIDQKPYLNNWKSVRESLGILLSNNFLIADKTLVVEGPSDVLYLLGSIKNMKATEEIDIDLNDLSIVDAGESQNYAAIVKVMLSEGRSIVSLVDGDSSGSKIKKDLEKMCEREIDDKKLIIKQLDENKSIEDYSVSLPTFKDAVKQVISNLLDSGARVLKSGVKLDTAINMIKKSKSKTLGKVLIECTGNGSIFSDPSDGVSKLSIALQYEDFAKDKELVVKPETAKLVKEIKKDLNLRGEKSAEEGVFTETS